MRKIASRIRRFFWTEDLETDLFKLYIAYTVGVVAVVYLLYLLAR